MVETRGLASGRPPRRRSKEIEIGLNRALPWCHLLGQENRKWEAQITHEGQTHYLGHFAEVDPEAAARAVDTAARRLGKRGRRNFPTAEDLASGSFLMKRQRPAAAAVHSRFVGVFWFKRGGKWHAMIYHEGKQQYLGCFVEEEAAARVFDTAARRLRGAQAPGARRTERQQHLAAELPDGSREGIHEGDTTRSTALYWCLLGQAQPQVESTHRT